MQYAACGAVLPFVSMWLRDRGLSYGQFSDILLAAASVALIFPFLWGMLADRFIPLNRLFIFINLLACAALCFLAAQTGYAGLRTAFVLYTLCMYPMFNLINAFGFHHLKNPEREFSGLRAWGSFGWIVPCLPISLWVAFHPQVGLDFTLFMGMGICAGMALLALFLPHTPPGARRRHDPNGQHPAYLPAVRQLLHNPNYLVVLVSMFLISGSFALVTFYSPPFLEGLGMKRQWIGPAQAIGAAFEIVLFQLQPVLIRRWNIVRTIVLGCLALVVRNLMFGMCSNIWALAFSYLLSGTLVVFYHIGISVLVNAVAGGAVRATAQTLMAISSQGLGPMFAYWMAGRLAGVFGDNLRPVFLFATGLAMLATLLIITCSRSLLQASREKG
jgi:MFS family permease